jgi:gamma-glutamylcyclotransferase (GGCT)/AIG2-like uncharacterized protein YtfP
VSSDADPASLPLFIYGSLRDPGVRARLLGHRDGLSTRPAVLRGYVRMLVPGFGYPFVVPAESAAQVEGDLLIGLTSADYAVLDEYEDVEDGLYQRAVVVVETPSGTQAACVYLKGPAEPPRS